MVPEDVVSFVTTWVLALLAAVAPLTWLLARSYRRACERRAEIASGSVLASQGASPVRAHGVPRSVLLVVAFATVVVSLARPRGGTEHQDVSGAGADVLLVLDISNSMKVQDVRGGRYSRARRIAAAMVDSGSALDRFGLAAVADEPRVECPLTTDFGALGGRLAELDVGSIGDGSSVLGSVADLAAGQFPDKSRPGVVVLLSDGEDHGGPLSDTRKAKLASSGAVLLCIGIGTERGGPVPNGDLLFGGQLTWNGQTVVSRLTERPLRELADAGHGQYVPDPGGSEQRVAALLRGPQAKVARQRQGMIRSTAVAREWYQLPLAVAILALAAEALLAALPGAARAGVERSATGPGSQVRQLRRRDERTPLVVRRRRAG